MRLAPLTAAVILVTALQAWRPAWADEWRPDLIARYESAGGRNVPNFKYDGPGGRYTAGGVCQMTDTTWRRIAPTIDIDIDKYPNAGSASEHMQWQACWKLWATDGYSPWTCCNEKFRNALATSPTPPPNNRPAVVEPKPTAPAPVRATPYPFLTPGQTPGQLVFTLMRENR